MQVTSCDESNPPILQALVISMTSANQLEDDIASRSIT